MAVHTASTDHDTLRPPSDPGEPQEICTVPISLIRGGDSPRLAGESSEHIELLASADGQLPPILVHRATMRVVDGMHRLRAALARGHTTVEVRFFDGDADEAFILAVRENVRHGLPLARADREAAAVRILRANPDRSDRWIADVVGLAASTVAGIRRRVVGEGAAGARLGRDGRVRPLSAAAGRRLAGAELARRPDAPLREIARMAGISLGTARDVRERLRNGRDPVPRSQREDGDCAPGSATRRPEPGRDGSRRDGRRMLASLMKDPALRHSESGRAVLRWLVAHAHGLDAWPAVLSQVPPHCVYVIAEVARACAEEWTQIATQLESRLANAP